MKIEKMEKNIFIDVLRDYCIKKEANIFAFWKFKALALDIDTDTFYIPEKDCYYSIYTNKIQNKKMLISYISKDEECHIPIEELNSLDCISLMANTFDKIYDNLAGFNVDYGYKLHYDYSYVPVAHTELYSIEEFDFFDEQHFIEAAAMINEEEEDAWFLPANVRKIKSLYEKSSVFEADLWFFAKDKVTNKLAGVTISSFDKEIEETDIDWVFILPQFQGKGAGRLLINETIKRSKDRSKSIKVGGANEFYKKCGFIEKDCNAWATKEGYDFVASCIQPNILP